MATLHNRRDFLKASAGLAGGAVLLDNLQAAQNPKPSERLRLAVVGTAGRGAANLAGVAHEEITALCDVDETRVAPARKQFPKARYYADFRRMLDQHKDFDAVVVSTPDHTHALVTVAAMRLNKHVYCEKPLTHSVHEGRVVLETAARQKVVTQMGTQIHAGANYRRVVEIIQAGVLGPIRRVHVWCSRRPDPGQLTAHETPPPAGLHYDLWLGPAPHRPYHVSHLHFDWRWWWDFGGGVLADMACHFMDLPHWALGLRSPTTVAATGQVLHKGDNPVPSVMQVEYEYPARGALPPVHLTWYHGVNGPDLSGKVTYRMNLGPAKNPKQHVFGSGVLFEGEKGSLVSDYSHHQLLPEDRFRDFTPPKPSIPASIGHHREWLDAIRSGRPTTCNFAYSGLLSETVLLGNVAYRAGGKLQWDAKTGRVLGNSKAEAFIRREYRKGWTLG